MANISNVMNQLYGYSPAPHDPLIPEGAYEAADRAHSAVTGGLTWNKMLNPNPILPDQHLKGVGSKE